MSTTMTGGKGMNIGLWAAQIALAAAFGMFGLMKAFQSLDQLALMMKWVPTMSPYFVRTLGMLEVLGAIGIILPSLTRILPRLTILTALCFFVLQVLAIALHAYRGETAETVGLNIVLISLSAFVLWGRSTKAVIAPRGPALSS